MASHSKGHFSKWSLEGEAEVSVLPKLFNFWYSHMFKLVILLKFKNKKWQSNSENETITSEAAAKKCTVEKVFLKILNNSQNYTVPEPLLKEVAGYSL